VQPVGPNPIPKLVIWPPGKAMPTALKGPVTARNPNREGPAVTICTWSGPYFVYKYRPTPIHKPFEIRDSLYSFKFANLEAGMKI
jgi:hypothetical protein